MKSYRKLIQILSFLFIVNSITWYSCCIACKTHHHLLYKWRLHLTYFIKIRRIFNRYGFYTLEINKQQIKVYYRFRVEKVISTYIFVMNI